MRQMLLATSIIAGSQFALGAGVGAQNADIDTPLRTYEGTFESAPGVTGIIKLIADFKSRSISADLAIPSPQSGAGMLPPESFRPSGLISKDEPTSYMLTQGAAFSAEPSHAQRTERQPHSSYILLTGSFWRIPGAGTRETSGTFVANFCVPETHCREMSSVAGTYSARAIR
jgi:hypothetical protein